MLGHAKQVSFVGVSDLDAAQRFYGGVLGLDLTDARPFALVHDTPAAQIRITAVHEIRAAPNTVLGWVLDDLEDEIDRLTAAGIDFNRYEGISQDQRGIWTAPDGTRIAWFHDPDGNNLSLQSRALGITGWVGSGPASLRAGVGHGRQSLWIAQDPEIGAIP